MAPLHVMTTAQGKPWSKDGPTGLWVKACKQAQPRIEKHLHDLRGKNVVAIRRRYGDRDRIARGADRLAGLTENA